MPNPLTRSFPRRPLARRFSANARTLLVSLQILAAIPSSVFAHGGVPPSLKGVLAAEAPGLASGRGRIVRNKRHAIALGKALFWDIQVGSDGVACATCHHQAGADSRITNQFSPGHRPEHRPTAATFEATGSGQAGGPNLTPLRADFPLHRLADPSDFASTVLFTTDDVFGSAGTFGGAFEGSTIDDPYDRCQRGVDSVFHVGAVGTRRVTSRNAPSVFNAGLARRLFWDGRANHRFNGSSAYGDRDPAAGVWTYDRKVLAFAPLALDDSALASQAVLPPVDSTEMSCADRTFADIGRKLLPRRPLQFQQVHRRDGVLGRYADRTGQGLKQSYEKLLKRAFAKRFWSAPAGSFGSPTEGGLPFTQAEANFAMFFGIAVQLYEATLLSDDAPFDSPRNPGGYPQALDAQQVRGLDAFLNFHCGDCHTGAVMAGAGATFGKPLTDVDRKPMRSSSGQLVLGLTDAGFENTAVVPLDHDFGLGILDPFGNALPFSVQFRDVLRGASAAPLDAMRVKACAMTSPFSVSTFGQPAFLAQELDADPAGYTGCALVTRAWVPNQSVAAAEAALPSNGRLVDGTKGAFRIPSLRNVELTGPYMHNGSMATLEEVVEFYDRGGNFSTEGKDAEFLFSAGMDAQTKADLVAFLKTLTDERVRWERAPFDHPSLPLITGHSGDGNSVAPALEAGFEGLAQTAFVELPAVGAEGRSPEQGPLLPFVDRLAD
jgi:cytochrome c peroxidase